MENISLHSIIINKLKNTSFITTALPYANGQLHLGHLFEAIVADIFHKNNENTVFLSGEDQHGAAITIFTKKNGINEESHIAEQYHKHLSQYKDLNIGFDFFGQTHDEFHSEICHLLFNKLYKQGKIYTSTATSWFDEQENQFLPDRYIRGKCPYCLSPNQYPDICEVCEKHFKAKEIIDPISALSGQSPTLKETTHYFLNTTDYYGNLHKLLIKDILSEPSKNKLLDGSLDNKTELDISRDKPYFGIPIDDTQCFYVWFDAPIAYLSFALKWLQNWVTENYGVTLSTNELTKYLSLLKFKHFIGKDIIYFHTYYWLNLLNDLQVGEVEKIYTHGWLTNDGKKLSKSDGDSFKLVSEDEVDILRYYYFSIYSDDIKDIDFIVKDAQDLYNQVIIGKYINLYSRVSKLIENNKTIIHNISLSEVYEKWFYENNVIKLLIKQAKFKEAHQKFVILLNEINAYIQFKKPWETQDISVCIDCYQIFLDINTWLKSIVSNLGKEIDNKVLPLSDIKNVKHQILKRKF